MTTNDDNHAARARAYRSHWLTPPDDQPPLSRLAHNFRLAEPLAALGRHQLPRLDELVQQRIEQTELLLDLLAHLPQVRPAAAPTGQRWNHFAPLLHLQLDRPRAFCEHLTDLGVLNSTGSFRLIPLDRRSMLVGDTPPTCTTAADLVDGILAVVLTRYDDETRIRDYAKTIRREVTRWASA